MNDAEAATAGVYAVRGWTPIRGGPPDFLMVKRGPDGRITEAEVVEVKAPDKPLTPEQEVWKEVLERAGIPYRIIRMKGATLPLELRFTPEELEAEREWDEKMRAGREHAIELERQRREQEAGTDDRET